MRKIAVVLCFVVVTALTLGIGFSEVDVLINKLVEKGLLSESEAKQLLNEMQKESARQKAEIEQVAADAAKKEVKTAPQTKLSKFLEKTKFSGDLRLRYQGEDTQQILGEQNTEWRDRGRFRWRLAAETQITDQWKAGFGLASGSEDPRSTNQTIGDTFSSKPVNIDLAYVSYKPYSWLSSVGGKFKNPLWEPKDLLWDTDIRPEGVAFGLKGKVRPKLEFFFTPCLFVIQEVRVGDDVYMLGLQPGMDWAINDTIDLKLTGAYYTFQNLKGSIVQYSSVSNSRIDGAYLWDYNSIAAGAELGFKLASPYVPYLALFGQYVHADTNQEDYGYLAGIKFGKKKSKKLGDWQFIYNYRHLERNAWPDFLPDSDFYGGATNSEGSEVEFTVGLAEHVTIGVDYYYAVLINKNDPALGIIGENVVLGLTRQNLVQVDLVLKW